MPRQKVTAHLTAMNPISEGLKNVLEKQSTLIRTALKKKDPLLIPNMKVDEAHYILSGLLKMYWREDGRELIFLFFTANRIITLIDEFLSGEENPDVYITAVEDTELLTITREKMGEIYADYPEAMVLTHKIAAKIRKARDLHTRILMVKEGQRYELLCSYFPELVHRLPEKDVCAFLSISRSTLREGKTNLVVKRMRKHGKRKWLA